MPESNQSGAPLLRLLFVDNAHTDYTLLVRFIEIGGYQLQSSRVENAVEMREALFSAAWDAVISESDLPGFPHDEVLRILRDTGFDTPFIVVTNSGDAATAVEALVAGADDYVWKSRLARLLPALQRAISAAAARRQERAEHARLRLLQSHLDNVNEVKTVACDLHDTFGELTTELAADFAWLIKNVEGDESRARVHHMQDALDRAKARAARGLRALRPPLLDLGIVNALHALAQRILRQHGIACEFAANRTNIALEEASFFAMYRVCQESLILFARHKHTKSIHIEVFAQAESVTLEIADDAPQPDGQGFSEATFRDLRDAVALLGGTLEISSADRHGTSIILSLPVMEGA